MPALIPTTFVGRILWLGVVRDRAAALEAAAVDRLPVTFAGPEGESHGGETRPSCSRVTAQYRRGTTIRNTRQLVGLQQCENILGCAWPDQEEAFGSNPDSALVAVGRP